MLKQLFIITMLTGFLMACQSSSHHAAVLPEYQFVADSEYMQTISQAQQQALQQNKLLLLVLGAQWCHDSQDLAAGLSKDATHKVLQQRFVTQFIDVGYFEDMHHVAQRFGYYAYFATPTVLVIDPANGALLNRDTIMQWQSPSSVSNQDFSQYFKDIGQQSPAILAESEQLSAFSHQQIQRLQTAIAHFSALWKDVIDGKTADTTELTTVSEQVWNYRIQLQKDLHRLQNELNQDPQASLVLPTYADFSWQ